MLSCPKSDPEAGRSHSALVPTSSVALRERTHNMILLLYMRTLGYIRTEKHKQVNTTFSVNAKPWLHKPNIYFPNFIIIKDVSFQHTSLT